MKIKLNGQELELLLTVKQQAEIFQLKTVGELVAYLKSIYELDEEIISLVIDEEAIDLSNPELRIESVQSLSTLKFMQLLQRQPLDPFLKVLRFMDLQSIQHLFSTTSSWHGAERKHYFRENIFEQIAAEHFEVDEGLWGICYQEPSKTQFIHWFIAKDLSSFLKFIDEKIKTLAGGQFFLNWVGKFSSLIHLAYQELSAPTREQRLLYALVAPVQRSKPQIWQAVFAKGFFEEKLESVSDLSLRACYPQLIASLELTQAVYDKEIPKFQSQLTNRAVFYINLCGAKLNGANFSRANLIGTNLSLATLSRANLLEATLSGAYLSGADLSYANLIEADLSRANLGKANLSRATLSGVNLSGAYLRAARLRVAYLGRATLNGANLNEATLSDADLSEATLVGATLIEANLIEANLFRANLFRANLSEANLSGANLSEAILSGADFIEANLNEVTLVKAIYDSWRLFAYGKRWGLSPVFGNEYEPMLKEMFQQDKKVLKTASQAKLMELETYVWNRLKAYKSVMETSPKEYDSSFLIFNFGYSKTEKIAAVEALLNVLEGTAETSSLEQHQGVLQQKALSGIFAIYEIYQTKKVEEKPPQALCAQPSLTI